MNILGTRKLNPRYKGWPIEVDCDLLISFVFKTEANTQNGCSPLCPLLSDRRRVEKASPPLGSAGNEERAFYEIGSGANKSWIDFLDGGLFRDALLGDCL